LGGSLNFCAAPSGHSAKAGRIAANIAKLPEPLKKA
jgi:hypothetical protein